MGQSANRLVGAIFGVVYLLVGIAGFLVSSGAPFAGTEGGTLLLFDVNPLHNVVHLAIGAVLLGAATASVPAARAANTTVGAVYLLVGLLGLFLIGSAANILALNGADNVLHLASAVLLLGVGLAADKRAAGSRVAARRA
jgi:uncharacterized membrane protein YuzA (DUF378 family)